MRTVALVESTRGRAPGRMYTECVHQGAVAIVDRNGRVLYSAGDPHALCFTRSTLKPLQALPFLEDDGLSHFEFGPRELALLCASHSAEPSHLQIVEKILRVSGCSESDLCCGVHAPLHYAATAEEPPAQVRWTQLHNNCSGKHSGFLAWCRLHEMPIEGYLDWGHPLQQRIRQSLAAVTRCAVDDLPAGIDGCSAPNYALPLASIAQVYARLAQGRDDPHCGPSFEAIFNAMTGYPELVSGQARTDLAYMTTAPGDWISKAGAEGMQVMGSRSAGLGIAVKIADGSARALHVAFVEVLEQLGLLREHPIERLEPWRNPTIRNHRNLQTGSVRPVFRLVPGIDSQGQ